MRRRGPHWLRALWIRFGTIRGRLTLWYVALLALVLLAFSSLLYLSLAHVLQRNVDRELAAEAAQVRAELTVDATGQELSPSATLVPESGTVLALYDATGAQLLASSP